MHKKILRPNLVQMGENETQNWVFCYFLKFDPLFSLQFALDDSLEQCPTTSFIKNF